MKINRMFRPREPVPELRDLARPAFLLSGHDLNSSTMFSRFFFPVIWLAVSILVFGCEETDTGAIDSANNYPSVSSPGISPDTVNVDTLTASDGLYTIQATGQVQATDADGDLSSVLLRILQRTSSETLSEGALHDDGVAPDAVAADGIFAGSVTFTLSRPETGPYRAQFIASDSHGLESNALELTFFAARANAPPSLDAASLVAPDTVVLPIGGSVAFVMSVAAQDSDGLADIRSVFFLSPDGTNPDFRFPLRDDGGTSGQSGDQFAGDGIFSILLSITDSPTIRGTYRLFFHAEDSFGDTSASVLHNLTIQ